MAKYECKICGYVFDEQQAGESFDNLYSCPICDADKSSFVQTEADEETTEAEGADTGEEDKFVFEENEGSDTADNQETAEEKTNPEYESLFSNVSAFAGEEASEASLEVKEEVKETKEDVPPLGSFADFLKEKESEGHKDFIDEILEENSKEESNAVKEENNTGNEENNAGNEEYNAGNEEYNAGNEGTNVGNAAEGGFVIEKRQEFWKKEDEKSEAGAQVKQDKPAFSFNRVGSVEKVIGADTVYEERKPDESANREKPDDNGIIHTFYVGKPVKSEEEVKAEEEAKNSNSDFIPLWGNGLGTVQKVVGAKEKEPEESEIKIEEDSEELVFEQGPTESISDIEEDSDASFFEEGGDKPADTKGESTEEDNPMNSPENTYEAVFGSLAKKDETADQSSENADIATTDEEVDVNSDETAEEKAESGEANGEAETGENSESADANETETTGEVPEETAEESESAEAGAAGESFKEAEKTEEAEAAEAAESVTETVEETETSEVTETAETSESNVDLENADETAESNEAKDESAEDALNAEDNSAENTYEDVFGHLTKSNEETAEEKDEFESDFGDDDNFFEEADNLEEVEAQNRANASGFEEKKESEMVSEPDEEGVVFLNFLDDGDEVKAEETTESADEEAKSEEIETEEDFFTEPASESGDAFAEEAKSVNTEQDASAAFAEDEIKAEVSEEENADETPAEEIKEETFEEEIKDEAPAEENEAETVADESEAELNEAEAGEEAETPAEEIEAEANEALEETAEAEVFAAKAETEAEEERSYICLDETNENTDGKPIAYSMLKSDTKYTVLYDTEAQKIFDNYRLVDANISNGLENIILLPAQCNPLPLARNAAVETKTVIGALTSCPVEVLQPFCFSKLFIWGEHIPNNSNPENYTNQALVLVKGEEGHIPNLSSKEELREEVEIAKVRFNGTPVGIDLVAGRIEDDLEACVYAKLDFVILNDVSSRILPYALRRARNYLNRVNSKLEILVCVEALKDAQELAKILALGANFVLVERGFDIEMANSMTESLKEICRSTGHNNVHDLNLNDICTIDTDLAMYTDISHV